MPNWMINTITMQGPPAALQEIYEANFDFQVLHPCPFPLDNPTDNRWYLWCCKHWGTKWSPSESELDLSPDRKELTIRCQTAWYAPHTFLAYLTTKYHDLCIRNEYQEESYAKVGFAEYEEGVAMNKYFEPHALQITVLEELVEEYDWFDLDSYKELYGEEADDEFRSETPKFYSWTETYAGLI